MTSSIAENTVKPTPKKTAAKPAQKPTPKKDELIQATIDEGIPEFEVEDEDEYEYVKFQGDDGD